VPDEDLEPCHEEGMERGRDVFRAAQANRMFSCDEGYDGVNPGAVSNRRNAALDPRRNPSADPHLDEFECFTGPESCGDFDNVSNIELSYNEHQSSCYSGPISSGLCHGENHHGEHLGNTFVNFTEDSRVFCKAVSKDCSQSICSLKHESMRTDSFANDGDDDFTDCFDGVLTSDVLTIDAHSVDIGNTDVKYLLSEVGNTDVKYLLSDVGNTNVKSTNLGNTEDTYEDSKSIELKSLGLGNGDVKNACLGSNNIKMTDFVRNGVVICTIASDRKKPEACQVRTIPSEHHVDNYYTKLVRSSRHFRTIRDACKELNVDDDDVTSHEEKYSQVGTPAGLLCRQIKEPLMSVDLADIVNKVARISGVPDDSSFFSKTNEQEPGIALADEPLGKLQTWNDFSDSKTFRKEFYVVGNEKLKARLFDVASRLCHRCASGDQTSTRLAAEMCWRQMEVEQQLK